MEGGVTLGRHYLFDYSGCDRGIIDNREMVREAMLEAARRAHATIVTDVFHEFSPQGISGVVVIAESHIAIHTWPEHGCVAVDIFSCGEAMDPLAAGKHLEAAFKARAVSARVLERGQPVMMQLPVTSTLRPGILSP